MTPDSRNLYRNHEKACLRREDGRKYKKCRCPIWVDFTFAGKRIYKSLRTRNWQKAEDLLRKWEADDLSAAKAQLPRTFDPPNAPPVRHTLEVACTAFLAEAKTRGLREPTLYKYRLLFQRLQAFTRDRGLRYVAEMNLEILRDFRATWPHRNTAARKRLEELRAFFRFCQDSGWIPNNPAKNLQPPIDTSAPAEPFTDGEVEKIRAACAVYPDGVGRTHQDHAQRLRALVEVMLHTGLRIRDAVTLRRDYTVDGKVRVRTEKTGTVVCCPLPPSLIQKLGAIRGASSQYFFWSGTSKPKSAVGDYQRSLKKLFKLAGISGGHAHRFRHTFAKSLFLARVPVEDIAVLMGHRNPAITLKHYSAWVPERQEQLEANIMRVWAEKDRPKKREKSPKRPESAIQPLCGNHPDWLN